MTAAATGGSTAFPRKLEMLPGLSSGSSSFTCESGECKCGSSLAYWTEGSGV